MKRWSKGDWREFARGVLSGIGVGCLAILFGATCAFLVGGCASTTIETPIGTYTSTRDSQLDELYIEITKSPDGTETTIVQVNGAKGSSSSVIDAQTELLRALIEAAFSAGLKAAPGG